MFSGSITALITPFRDGQFDEKSFSSFVNWQIEQGTKALVPVGTTGETPTLTHEEHRRVVKVCMDVAGGRVPIMAGAGSNSTAEAVELAQFAQEIGAQGVLCAAPYYNKPNQEGLFQHYKAIAQSIDIELYLYNIPGRSIIDISVDTMKRLRDACPNIAGVKDATADMGRVSMQRHIMDDAFVQLSGEDMTALGFNAHGGQGCISVTSNIAPALCAQLQSKSIASDFKGALAVQDQLAPLHKALFIEPSPAGVKYAASRLGLCANELRLPLVPITAQTEKIIDAALAHAGLI